MAKSADLVRALKVKSKILENLMKTELRTSEKERETARRHVQKGETAAARLHCERATRAAKRSKSAAEGATAIDGMIHDIESSTLSASVVQSLVMATEQLGKTAANMDPAGVLQLKDRYVELTGRTDTIHTLVTEREPDMGTEELLDHLQQEVNMMNQGLVRDSGAPAAVSETVQLSFEGA